MDSTIEATKRHTYQGREFEVKNLADFLRVRLDKVPVHGDVVAAADHIYTSGGKRFAIGEEKQAVDAACQYVIDSENSATIRGLNEYFGKL